MIPQQGEAEQQLTRRARREQEALERRQRRRRWLRVPKQAAGRHVGGEDGRP